MEKVFILEEPKSEEISEKEKKGKLKRVMKELMKKDALVMKQLQKEEKEKRKKRDSTHFDTSMPIFIPYTSDSGHSHSHTQSHMDMNHHSLDDKFQDGHTSPLSAILELAATLFE